MKLDFRIRRIQSVIVPVFFSLGLACFAQTQTADVEQVKANAEKGEAKSQVALAIMYYRGQGVLQHFSEAARWFRKAADQGDPLAQKNLGVLYS